MMNLIVKQWQSLNNMKFEILNKDELKLIIKTMYIAFIGLINIVLIDDLTKINSEYDILGIPNTIILLCLAIYYYLSLAEINDQKKENKKSEDLKRFGLV